MVPHLVVYSSAQTQFVVLDFNLNVFSRPLFTLAKTLPHKQTRKNMQTTLLEPLHLHFHTRQTCAASQITYYTVGTTLYLKITFRPLKKKMFY